MGADLYESYCGSILATAALGAALPWAEWNAAEFGGLRAILAPMVIAGLGILFSVIGIFIVRTKEKATMKKPAIFSQLRYLGKFCIDTYCSCIYGKH
jgi:K(+)-stimulated pyrophosphate-energized sodium pump